MNTARLLGVGLWALGLVPVSGLVCADQHARSRRSFTDAPFRRPNCQQGTVTVRVVREAIGNNVAGQDVRLTVERERRELP